MKRGVCVVCSVIVLYSEERYRQELETRRARVSALYSFKHATQEAQYRRQVARREKRRRDKMEQEDAWEEEKERRRAMADEAR
jgi:hypothetical protein